MDVEYDVEYSVTIGSRGRAHEESPYQLSHVPFLRDIALHQSTRVETGDQQRSSQTNLTAVVLRFEADEGSREPGGLTGGLTSPAAARLDIRFGNGRRALPFVDDACDGPSTVSDDHLVAGVHCC